MIQEIMQRITATPPLQLHVLLLLGVETGQLSHIKSWILWLTRDNAGN